MELKVLEREMRVECGGGRRVEELCGERGSISQNVLQRGGPDVLCCARAFVRTTVADGLVDPLDLNCFASSIGKARSKTLYTQGSSDQLDSCFMYGEADLHRPTTSRLAILVLGILVTLLQA